MFIKRDYLGKNYAQLLWSYEVLISLKGIINETLLAKLQTQCFWLVETVL